MQCPNCEAENRDGAKFCNECGFPLSGAIARAAGAASPAGASQRRERPAYGGASEPLPETQPPVFAGQDARPEPGHLPPAEIESEPADSWPAAAGDSGELDRGGSGTQDAFEALDPFDDAFEIEPWPFDDHPVQDVPDRSVPPMSAFDVPEGSYPYANAAEGDFAYAAQQMGPDDEGDWPADYTMEMPRVGRKAAAARDFRVGPAGRQGKSKRLALFVIAGIVVGTLAAVAAVTYAVGLWGGVAVPNVAGMTEADARSVLTAEGFSVRATQVKSDDTEGLVLITDPEAGARAPEGSEVVVHIATARFVPDLIGKNGDEARVLLSQAGYENVRFDMQKSDGEENIVLDVSPEAGTRAKSNAEIVVKVSEAYRVPAIEGLGLDAAADAVRDAGLTPEIVYIDTDQFADGTIIGSNPEAGTKVSQGSAVSISVARARGMELVGLTEELFSTGNTVTVGGVDYEIESVISVSYQGDDTVTFTANGRPKITFFGETLYASSSQTISGQVVWSEDNEVVSIY